MATKGKPDSYTHIRPCFGAGASDVQNSAARVGDVCVAVVAWGGVSQARLDWGTI